MDTFTILVTLVGLAAIAAVIGELAYHHGFAAGRRSTCTCRGRQARTYTIPIYQ